MDKELTIPQVADMLNVSYGFIIHLVDCGELAINLNGTIKPESVEAYKEKREKIREQVLDELVAQSQELGLYE